MKHGIEEAKFSRRDFLRRLAFVADSDKGEHRHTLVCVFLRGGADTLNMIVPYGDDDYYKARPTLSIKSPEKKGGASAVKLNDFYGLHPKLAPLLTPYRDGRLAIIQAVGCDSSSGSHFEAQDQMEHGERSGQQLNGGWLGRHLRSLGNDNLTPMSAVAIGTSLPESLRGAPSASAISSIEDLKLNFPGGDTTKVANALAALYGTRTDLLGTAGRTTLELLRKVEKMEHKSYRPVRGAEYPDSTFGHALREVARLVKSCVGLEVACIDHGGWDTHFFQGAADGLQAANIEDLGKGLSAFDKDLSGWRERVTTVVITEFGRRTYENSSMGTDHGRGFACMVMGGRTAGGQVYGSWPGLTEEPLLFLGPAGLTIEIDFRSVFSELLSQLMGNKRTDLVFPDFNPQRIGVVQ